MLAQKLNIITKLLGGYQRQGTEYLFYCPRCEGHHKPKLSINFKKNMFKCWVCGYRGRNIANLIQDNGSFGDVQEFLSFSFTDVTSFYSLFDHNHDSKFEINLPEGYLFLESQPKTKRGKEALRYLRNRGIDYEHIVKYKIGYTEKGSLWGHIIFPSFNKSGELNLIIARTFLNHKNPYTIVGKKNDNIFNEHDILWSEDVFLTEGVVDAIKIGNNAIPLLGKELNPKSYLFKQIVFYKPRVYICLDKGEHNSIMKIADLLKLYDIDIRIVDPSPAKDMGELTHKEIINKINHSKLYSKMEYRFSILGA